MIEITSERNDLYKHWLSLLSSKGIRNEHQFILSGEKLIREFLNNRNSNFQIKAELICEGLTSVLPQKDKMTFKLSNKLYENLDSLGTHHNLLVLEHKEFEVWQKESKPKGLEVISPIGDPKNLGSMLRSALAFGVNQIILTKESTHPFHPQCLKASAGANLQLKFLKTESIQNLKTMNYYCLDLDGERLSTFQWPKDLYLVLGEEGPGLPKDHNFKKISIKTNKVESLNVSVSAGIAFYDYQNKRGF